MDMHGKIDRALRMLAHDVYRLIHESRGELTEAAVQQATIDVGAGKEKLAFSFSVACKIDINGDTVESKLGWNVREVRACESSLREPHPDLFDIVVKEQEEAE